ncbi:dirp, partial [Oesophagostomum dentatum]
LQQLAYFYITLYAGKPRRCSSTFFDEERRILDQRRRKVRGIYDGSYTSVANCDLSDMPPNLPAPLVVGMKVYARLRTPKDGIYGGTIDALVSGGGGYRIVFDKEDMIPPAFVPDYEVMYDGSLELLSLSYFLQQNNARLPLTLSTSRTVPVTYPTKQKRLSEVNHEKVGNFPVRMLVILVKVAKLLDIKKKLVKTLTELNNEAERESILTDKYTPVFQIRSLGQQKMTPMDLTTLSESINEIRQMISPKNYNCFQDHVEVHMRQVHNVMLKSGAVAS